METDLRKCQCGLMFPNKNQYDKHIDSHLPPRGCEDFAARLNQFCREHGELPIGPEDIPEEQWPETFKQAVARANSPKPEHLVQASLL